MQISSVGGEKAQSEGLKPMSMSLSELEGLLANSSGAADHVGLVQKLKALQLVEQMIATQEQLLSTEENGTRYRALGMYGSLYCVVFQKDRMLVHRLLK